MPQDNPFSPAAVPTHTTCKCCSADSVLVAVVDAARSGVDVRAGYQREPLTGCCVYYYRCHACGFTFTRAFDHWSPADFAARIYNTDYAKYDPDYANAERGIRTAQDILRSFSGYAAQLTVLDWGSGIGSFAATLRKNGFVNVDSYDPFVIDVATPPQERYEMVTCFEVIEHVLDPKDLIATLAKHRRATGAILLSTLCCTQQVVDFGLENWFYCVPRNGHISFMTAQSLQYCAQQVGLAAYSYSQGAHVLFDPASIPAWLAQTLPSQR